MDAHWVHQRAGYRCRHGYRSTTSRPLDAPENIYLREDEILQRITARISLGVEPHAKPRSTQEVINFLRANDMLNARQLDRLIALPPVRPVTNSGKLGLTWHSHDKNSEPTVVVEINPGQNCRLQRHGQF
jgi:hypothetical protein